MAARSCRFALRSPMCVIWGCPTMTRTKGMSVPGGKAHEICAPDLAGVCDRSDLAVPVPVFALGCGSPALLGPDFSNDMSTVLRAVSSSHAAGRGLLTWLHASEFIGCGWRVQDV